MKKLRLLFVLVLGATLGGNVFPSEAVLPDGYNIVSDYTLNSISLTYGDTLVITRILVNNESFSLAGVYFSENLPAVFEIVSEQVSKNGAPLSFVRQGPFPDSVLAGYSTYYWVIDSPDSSENIHNSLASGDSLFLEIKIVSTDIGDYLLPFHTTVCYGDSTGIFSVSDSTTISVTIGADVNGNQDNSILLPEYLTTSAFPNPFNSDVTIAYEGKNLRGNLIDFEVYDVLGRLVYSQEFRAGDDYGEIKWHTSPQVSSGVFFYRISSNNLTATGKLMLLK